MVTEEKMVYLGLEVQRVIQVPWGLLVKGVHQEL
jgi:hypothetical protein